MKRFILFLSFINLLVAASAQKADQKINQLIGQSDWFNLEKEYPLLKDSIQSKVLKLFAEIMIGNNFNRPQEALDNIKILLTNHQNEIGFSNICNMVFLASIIDGQRGNYGKAADNIKSFIDQLKVAGVKDNLEKYEAFYAKNNKLRNYPVPSVSRPDKDTEIAITIDPVKLLKPLNGETFRGLQIKIPVVIKNKTYQFIFDTGAATSFLSEAFAKEVGVQITNDSVLVNKGMMGEGYGMEGYLDSMQIGDITFKNLITYISKPNPTVDSIIQIDAVLGMDFMKLVEEFQIYTKEKKIIFPAKPSNLPTSGRNLLLTNGNGLRLKANHGNDPLLFVFDTGNNTTDFFHSYYSKYKKEIDKVAIKDTITGGGFGFIRSKEILLVPSIVFNIGNTAVKMKNVRVHPAAGNDQTAEDGNVGMDLIKLFSKITINFKDMFAVFE